MGGTVHTPQKSCCEGPGHAKHTDSGPQFPHSGNEGGRLDKVPSDSEAGDFTILVPDFRTFQDERGGGDCPEVVSSPGDKDSSLGPQGPSMQVAESCATTPGSGVETHPLGTQRMCRTATNPADPLGAIPGHHNTVLQGRRPDEITTTINERFGPE